MSPVTSGQDIHVLTIGSIHLDQHLLVSALPRSGETVIAHAVSHGLGGKGANQAVAAARAGARSEMVGFVGDDGSAAELLARLSALGVGTGGVISVHHTDSGAAMVTRDVDGANQIVVSPGASAMGEISDHALAEPIGRARVVVLQGEIPPAITRRAAAIAADRAVRTVINLAPVVDLGAELGVADPLIVNEIEARQLLGGRGDAADDVDLARRLGDRARSVVVTLGDRGAVFSSPDGGCLVAAPKPVRVVDTTGAGDAFVGALAARLALGISLEGAVRFAVAAATRTVEAAGAAESYPLFEEVVAP
jgi:ribokinase